MSKLIAKSVVCIHVDSLFYTHVEVMLCVKMQCHILWVGDDTQELCMLLIAK